MRSLPRYLWKEWRDQRAIVLGFLLVLPALLLFVRWLVPGRDIVGDALFPWVVAAGSGAIALLSVGSDLVPGEDRRGTIAFLRRMPAGLLAPFLAKLVVFVAAVAGFTLYGWLLAGWIGRVDGTADGRWDEWIPWLVAGVPWVLVVSCWLPRGSLALPGTALLLALVAAPVGWIMLSNRFVPHWLLVPERGALLSVPVALVVAALSFARFRRFGRGPLAAAWRGVLLTLLAATPLYADVGVRLHRWKTLSVAPADLRLSPVAYVSPGFRYAFLNARNGTPDRLDPNHALVVDLGTGGHREVGGLFDDFVPHCWQDPHVGPIGLAVPMGLVPLNEVFTQRRGDLWLRWLDGRTGETAHEGWRSMTPDAVRAEVDRARRSATAARTADGRRAWFSFGKIRWDTPDGEVHVVDPGFEPYSVWPCGLGLRLEGRTPRAPRAVFDLARGRLFRDIDALGVRPGGWLVRDGARVALLDPDTGARRPAPEPIARATARVVLPDGRLLLAIEGAIVRFDPGTGRLEPVAGPGAERLHLEGFTPGGAPIVRLGVARFARFDAEAPRLLATAALASPDGSPRLLAAPDEASVLVLGLRPGRVVRAGFGSSVLETLFPR